MFRALAAPRRDESGRIIRWYGTTEDIEEQTRADEERRAAEERYRLASHAANDAIWEPDLSCNQVHRAPSVDGFLGHPQVEATRSEEHTSELQSLMRSSSAVFCLKQKNKQDNTKH